MPLADMNVSKEDVNMFWDRQGWDLVLPRENNLSNCVFCFLKGVSKLRNIHREMNQAKGGNGPPGYGSLRETPCDLDWWTRMEKLYGRDLVAEGREIRADVPNDILGFFGANGGFSYDLLSKSDNTVLDKSSEELLPCDCTE